MDLAEVVADARHFEPVALRVHHAPPGEIVEGRAPQHGLLAAGIHGDVAADARGIGGSRIHREHEAGRVGRLFDPPRDGTDLGVERRYRTVHARQRPRLDGVDALELLGVDDGGGRRERHRAAGVSRAAAARDDRQAELDAGAHQPRDLVLRVRREHHEGNLHAPVGRVGSVRDARVRVEADVVGARVATEFTPGPPAQGIGVGERLLEGRYGPPGGLEQPTDLRIALAVGGVTPAVDLAEPVVQGLDEQRASPRVVEQVLLEVRVAPHHPDVAEHLVEHAGRAAGAPLRAQFVEQLPAARAKQPDDDLAVGERGVVVRDLAQPGGRVERVTGLGRDGASGRERYGVHGPVDIQRQDRVIVARRRGIGYCGNWRGRTAADHAVRFRAASPEGNPIQAAGCVRCAGKVPR